MTRVILFAWLGLTSPTIQRSQADRATERQQFIGHCQATQEFARLCDDRPPDRVQSDGPDDPGPCPAIYAALRDCREAFCEGGADECDGDNDCEALVESLECAPWVDDCKYDPTLTADSPYCRPNQSDDDSDPTPCDTY